MTDLVFLEPNKLGSEPFTTSKVIAEFAGIGHKKLKSAIVKHKEGLQALEYWPHIGPIFQGGGVGSRRLFISLTSNKLIF